MISEVRVIFCLDKKSLSVPVVLSIVESNKLRTVKHLNSSKKLYGNEVFHVNMYDVFEF